MFDHRLISLLDGLNYFKSIYESRILSYLIGQPNSRTAKEICRDLEIPNSKTYPALNNLEGLELIERQSTGRPSKFYFKDPEKLRSYLENRLQDQMDKKQTIIDEIIDETITLWDPDEPELGKIAYIFHGNEIGAQITRIQKNTRSEIFYLLSPSMRPYLEKINKQLNEILSRNHRVNLAVPSALAENITDSLDEKIYQSKNLKLRESIWSGTSYIIRDHTTMLSITHRSAGDTAILTNDPLMVQNIAKCWDDNECCIKSEDLIELEIPE